MRKTQGEIYRLAGNGSTITHTYEFQISFKTFCNTCNHVGYQ